MMMRPLIEKVGVSTVQAVEEAGYQFSLFAESLYWLILGPFLHQPVRLRIIVSEMMKIGVLRQLSSKKRLPATAFFAVAASAPVWWVTRCKLVPTIVKQPAVDKRMPTLRLRVSFSIRNRTVAIRVMTG